MSSLQFYHDKYNGHTYCVDVAFTREDLLETVHHFDQSIAFVIGKSIVHPKDNYCKATGREVSAGKMKPVMLYFQSVYKEDAPIGEDGEKLFLEFSEKGGPAYTFRVNAHSEKPHFIKVC